MGAVINSLRKGYHRRGQFERIAASRRWSASTWKSSGGDSLEDRYDDDVVLHAAGEQHAPAAHRVADTQEMSYQAALDRLAEEDDIFGFSIEVAYLLDMTGSMGAWMRTSAQQLIAITQEIKQRMQRECGSAAHVRFSLIGYRDHCDGHSRHFVRFPANGGFSSRVEDVCNAISTIPTIRVPSRACSSFAVRRFRW